MHLLLIVCVVVCLSASDMPAGQAGLHSDNIDTLFISGDLQLIRISDNAYVHMSYSELPGFGRFASNGLIFIDNKEAFLFDTPITENLTVELVTYIQDSMKIKIAGFVPNHWHNDCIGGLGYLLSIGIESYANDMTIDIAKIKNLPAPIHGFSDTLVLMLHDKKIFCRYYGAGHTSDNIVCYIPSEKILFGGCMVKEFASKGLGNIADADLEQWPLTIKKVKDDFSDAEIVIPGHGAFGGQELLDHTLKLLQKSK